MIAPLLSRDQFPLLAQTEYRHLAYLDNAATTQKPMVVLEAIQDYYREANANIHRGLHHLSERSTIAWQEARRVVAAFLGAQPSELIVTRNATEALNGVALGWARYQLRPGDVVLTSLMEHHANLVPWQEVCRATGAELKLIPLTPEGVLDQAWYQGQLSSRVKLVALQHLSNVFGLIHPVETMIAEAHRAGARFLLDAAQAVAQLPVHFGRLGADFLAFSGHKLYGPMGSGGLLVRAALLESGEMRPWLFGGGMISTVSASKAEFQTDPSERFTAGTPDVASLVGLAAATRFLSSLTMSAVEAHSRALTQLAFSTLARVKRVSLLGPQEPRLGLVSFNYQGVHPHDLAQFLDSRGLATRSGHHCCMPLHQALGLSGSTRASFAVYNSEAELARLAQALDELPSFFAL